MCICTFYIVRHGQTQWNVDRMIQGHTNIPLNKTGELQAHQQRDNLKHIHFSKVYSSDLLRAHKTAEILNLERKLIHETTTSLRERSFGLIEGKNMDNETQIIWDILAKHDGNHPHLKKVGVESNDKIMQRTLDFLQKISTLHRGENILIVTHGGVMKQMLIYLRYAKKTNIPPGAVQNLAYIQLECDGVHFWIKNTVGIELTKK